jgi:hypothetical protein
VSGAELRGAVVEIYERGGDNTDVGPGSILAPNEIRINGVPVYCPDDAPPVVERICVDQPGAVRVTLTVYARRVIIDDAAPDIPTVRFASGGWLPPGDANARNDTDVPERVLPKDIEPERNP